MEWKIATSKRFAQTITTGKSETASSQSLSANKNPAVELQMTDEKWGTDSRDGTRKTLAVVQQCQQ